MVAILPGRTSLPPTYSEPDGSKKSLWTSTTTSTFDFMSSSWVDWFELFELFELQEIAADEIAIDIMIDAAAAKYDLITVD